MIYKLPIANGINVSDSNQKTENLNGLSVLPMVDCTGVEYNGAISGWSRKITENQKDFDKIPGAEEKGKMKLSVKSVFSRGMRHTLDMPEPFVVGRENSYPQTDDDTMDYAYKIQGTFANRVRDFFPPEVVDVIDGGNRLELSASRKKLSLITTIGGVEKSYEKEHEEPIIMVRFLKGKSGANNGSYIHLATTESGFFVGFLRDKEENGETIQELFLTENRNRGLLGDFLLFFESLSGDVYVDSLNKTNGEMNAFYVGRKFFGVSDLAGTDITQVESSAIYIQHGSTIEKAAIAGAEGLVWIAPYYIGGTLYANAAYKGDKYFISLVSFVWAGDELVKEENANYKYSFEAGIEKSINEFSFCWSEFEFYCQKTRYCRANKGMLNGNRYGLAGISELSAYADNGMVVNTVNRIPATLDYNDMMIGGQSGEILTAFPINNNYLYHESGRVIRFIPRDSSDKIEAMSGMGVLYYSAISRVKNAICKIASKSQPIFFDYDNKKPMYGCMGYTGAIETDIIYDATEEQYSVTYCAPILQNEISNTLWSPKPILIHADVVTGKVKVRRRLPKFTGVTPPDTDPIFSFYCSDSGVFNGDAEKEGVKTVDLRYMYDFSATRHKIDTLKLGKTYKEGVADEGGIYQMLTPLPVWANVYEDNHRIADGGNVTFFCATNPSPEYRGKGSIGYTNYYVGSYFENLQGYCFIGGKHFIQIENALSELQILPNGIQGAVTRYIENVKFDYVGQSQAEAYYISRADKTLYKYTGFYQMSPFMTFSNVGEISRGQYLSTMNALILWVNDSRDFVYFVRGSAASRLAIQGFDVFGKEIEKNGNPVLFQEDNGREIHVYNSNYYTDTGEACTLSYLDYSLQKSEGYKQQSFSLDTSYIGIPYTELQVFSIALTFNVELEAGDEIPVSFRYRWRYAESAGSEEAEYAIKYDDTESDPNGRRFVRFRFIPAVQKVVDFSIGISVPNLEKDVTVQSVEFAGVDIDAEQKDKPLIGERCSR